MFAGGVEKGSMMREPKTDRFSCARGTRRARTAFTLVEMLVVLIIVGILLAITIPAFEKLAVGSGVDAAARMVGAQLRLARQHAIANRVRTAVLLPGPNAPGDMDEYAYVAFRSCEVERNASAPPDFTFASWIEGTKWEFLPVGATITEADEDYQDDDTVSSWPDETSAEYTTVGSVPEPDGTGVFTCRAIVFHPSGRMDAGLGKYVTVSESVSQGGSLTHRNRRNMQVIEVDEFSGRITHVADEDWQ